ncbi:helix-turn-helix domain-containing protein [Ruegeria profundi]|uniref:helix-turn-helix domain-containing protein n=1 Tax=Ruegeria profundi TaxID=1685378 RepID=UPI001F21EA92|nr:AraC family transcriptional regulator [Ruegeria profundi]
MTQARFDQALQAQHADRKSDVYRGKPIFEALASSALLATLFSTLNEPDAFDAHHADNYVNAIVSDILRSKSPILSSTLAKVGKLPRHDIKLISEFVDANLDKPLTNERLAGLLNMPEAAFARQFKATTTLAPYQFILKRRVEHARHLLITTKWPIAQIAFECGFSSQSHFTTTFKARVGTTPNALRQTVAAH